MVVSMVNDSAVVLLLCSDNVLLVLIYLFENFEKSCNVASNNVGIAGRAFESATPINTYRVIFKTGGGLLLQERAGQDWAKQIQAEIALLME
jgi:hypothetical protein